MGYHKGAQLLWMGLPIVANMMLRLFRFALFNFVWKRVLAPAAFSSEYFTPSTLTKIFQESGLLSRSSRVKSIRYEKMTCGGVGEVRRMYVEYDGDDVNKLPKSFVVKELGKVVKDIVLSSLVDLVGAEEKGYTILAKVAGDLQPKCFYFKTSPFGSGVMILEDLGHLRHKTSLEGATVEDIRAVLCTAATLHSRTWGEGEKYGSTFRLGGDLLDNLAPRHYQQCVNGPWMPILSSRPDLLRGMRAVSTFESDDCVFLKLRGSHLNEPASSGLYARPFGCIVHGDLRLDNCFFTQDGKVLPVDWQVCMYRHPLLDVCWALMDLDIEHLGYDPAKPDDTSGFAAACDDLLLSYLATLQEELRKQRGGGSAARVMTLADAKADMPLIALFIAKYILVVLSNVVKEDPVKPGEVDASGKPKENSPFVRTIAKYIRHCDWLLKCLVTEEIYASIGAPL